MGVANASAWRLRAVFTALACFALSAPNASAQTDSVVTVSGGQVRGAQANGIISFKGIPYAAPPIGPLRWRAPRPAPAWTGVRNATAFGNDCMQRRVGWDATQTTLPVSEDCLTLNVWRAADVRPGAPVMVWIHGGAFVMGSGSQPIFDGASLARRGAIVVTFNYRLGRFGFFAHPALSAEQAGQPRANYAFMDQIAALHWVRANIAAFGGDPNNVTIFGESAGGGSVLQLMLMAPARGLFQRAIVQSGGGRDIWPRLTSANGARPAAEQIGRTFATRAGLANATAAALRALPAERLVGRLELLNMEEATFSGPIIDGLLVRSNACDGFAAGRQARVPLLVGANSDELGFIPVLLRGVMNMSLAGQLGDNRRTVRTAFGNTWDARFASDLNFVEPARRIADLSAAAGSPTFLYNFGYVPESKRRAQTGALHASDLSFVFDTLAAADFTATDSDRAAARLVSEYWLAFARSGDPNGETRPQWPAYRGDDTLLEFTNSGARLGRLNAGPLDALEAHYSQ